MFPSSLLAVQRPLHHCRFSAFLWADIFYLFRDHIFFLNYICKSVTEAIISTVTVRMF